MSNLKFKFSDDAKTVFFCPSPNIVYYDDKDAPKLKRLAPRRPPLNPAPPEKDDNTTPATEDES
ncbi:MAG: hypothetical protein OXG85_00350 [Chloroflexi bacterium]|nr:hypothetical protein [Chloroflexota bacterium]